MCIIAYFLFPIFRQSAAFICWYNSRPTVCRFYVHVFGKSAPQYRTYCMGAN
jgi:hypothetical protein